MAELPRANPDADTFSAPGDNPTRQLNDGEHAHEHTERVDLGASDLQRLTAEPRYESISLLGRGGMGDVWLCRDLRVGREVAMKTIAERHAANPAVLQRMLREAAVQGQLDHPAIVPVYDLGLGARGLFFTMKRVRGVSLAEVLRGLAQGDEEIGKKFSTRRLLSAFVTVCLAVDFAHKRGVLHRDLKPANIMLGDFGEVFVLDWGVAKVQGTEEAPDPWKLRDISAATPTAVVGTPGYMAPEQARGALDRLDARADVYALGAILFEILTLERLHRGDLQQVFLSTATTREGRPAERAPGRVPPPLDELCARATRIDVEGRLPDVRSLAEAIEAHLDGDQHLSMRRELAEQGRRRAHEEASASGGDAARAVREAARAVALEPGNPQSIRLLESLIEQGGAHPSPEAEEAYARERDERSRLGARLAWGRVALAAAIGLLLLLLPPRSPAWALTSGALVLASAALNVAWLRSREPSLGPLGAAAFLATVSLVASTCGLLGPFILIPTTLVLQGALTLIVNGFRQRAMILGACGAGLLVPSLLSAAGFLPPLFTFTGDTLLIHGRLVGFSPWLGPALLVLHLLVVLAPLALFCGLHDRQNLLDRRVFLQAWHLRNLGRALPRRRGHDHGEMSWPRSSRGAVGAFFISKLHTPMR